MALIIHGFPSSTAALRFEWAWQHPHLSRRLKHVPKKRSNQTTLDFLLMVLSEMLQVGPWHRLPLTVRWLDDGFGEKYSDSISAPLHMPIVFGKVGSKKLSIKEKEKDARDRKINEDDAESTCSICRSVMKPEEKVTCINPRCRLIAHLVCLAEAFTKDDMILPIDGECPQCKCNVLWGDLIRNKIGCNLHLEHVTDSGSESDD